MGGACAAPSVLRADPLAGPRRQPGGGGMTPIWTSIPTMSMLSQPSLILPSRMRNIRVAVQRIGRPVGGMPMNGPSSCPTGRRVRRRDRPRRRRPRARTGCPGTCRRRSGTRPSGRRSPVPGRDRIVVEVVGMDELIERVVGLRIHRLDEAFDDAVVGLQSLGVRCSRSVRSWSCPPVRVRGLIGSRSDRRSSAADRPSAGRRPSG